MCIIMYLCMHVLQYVLYIISLLIYSGDIVKILCACFCRQMQQTKYQDNYKTSSPTHHLW